MNDFIIYLLKVNIAIALFYMFYRLFFAGDTLWRARRIYMLSAVLLSFAYPFFSIEGWLQQQETVKEFVMNYAVLPEFTVGAVEQSTFFTVNNLLASAYVVVITALMLKLLLQLVSILKIKRSGHFETIQNTRVLVVEKEIAPFSFFGTIYINPALHNEAETAQILTHELTHVRQWHSLDVMLSEILCIVFWINPATWLLKREIRQNLEFLADDKVLSSGFDSKSYQYHLLQLSYQTPDYKLSNKFNILPLKKRIIMMNQKKSSKSTALKYLLIAPLTFSLVVISNAESLAGKASEFLQTEIISVPDKPNKANEQPKPKVVGEVQVVGYGAAKTKDEKEPVVQKVAETPNADDDETIFTVVEDMPKYPGGDSELFKYLSNSVRYPVRAQEHGIQGRVICQFVVNTDGSVQAAEVVRGVDPDLDAEAIRVINGMPKWIPGMQKGKAVRVKYTLPLNFRLQGGTEKKQTTIPEIDPQNAPVIAIDGAVMPKAFNLNIIKADAIERVDVLKPVDEAHKADLIQKYGEQAKNGVILIITKR
ncbi:MAG: TonB family protein [Paludibacteraceae bacterium]|nr:TonB family protein [Paludibacteraceae bacterium]